MQFGIQSGEESLGGGIIPRFRSRHQRRQSRFQLEVPSRCVAEILAFPANSQDASFLRVKALRSVPFFGLMFFVEMRPGAKPCGLGRSVRAHSHEWRGEGLLRRPAAQIEVRFKQCTAHVRCEAVASWSWSPSRGVSLSISRGGMQMEVGDLKPTMAV